MFYKELNAIAWQLIPGSIILRNRTLQWSL